MFDLQRRPYRILLVGILLICLRTTLADPSRLENFSLNITRSFVRSAATIIPTFPPKNQDIEFSVSAKNGCGSRCEKILKGLKIQPPKIFSACLIICGPTTPVNATKNSPKIFSPKNLKTIKIGAKNAAPHWSFVTLNGVQNYFFIGNSPGLSMATDFIIKRGTDTVNLHFNPGTRPWVEYDYDASKPKKMLCNPTHCAGYNECVFCN